MSLARLLRRAGVPPRAWSSVQVGSVFLTDDQYQAFPDETPPAFFDDQGDATFIVPDRGDRTGVIVPGAPSVAASRYSVSITPRGRGDRRGRFGRLHGGGQRRSGRVSSTSDGTATASTRGADGRSPTASRTRAARPCRSRSRREARRWRPTPPRCSSIASPTTTTTAPAVPARGPAAWVTRTRARPPTAPGRPPPTHRRPTTRPARLPARPRPRPRRRRASPIRRLPRTRPAEVAGDLLADTTPIPPAGSTGADAGLPDTPEEAADESELAISGAVVAAGLAAVLLALGAGWEFERIHPRRWLRRPDLSRLRRLLPR